MIRWLGPRLSPKRAAYAFIILSFITLAYISLSRTKHATLDLPALNRHQDDGSIAVPAHDKEPKRAGDVFSDSLRVDQSVPFSEMKPFKRYNLMFHGRSVGKVSAAADNHRYHSKFDDKYKRENATFFSLVKNEDLTAMIDAIVSVENRFNSRYHYDWVFANNEPFHPTFVTMVKKFVSGKALFVEIPQSFWGPPEWINSEQADKTREEMEKEGIKYGGSEHYRNMCRFNSGFFYRLPEMQNYKYYWRVEPDVKFNCDLFSTDWFKFMRENDKKYAFNLAPLELHTTVVGLWETVQSFSNASLELVAKDNNMKFLTEDDGATYNMCHFWSNFEIGDLDFFRLPAYAKFFDHIDQAGGFYYSRWGDAPVHTMAVSLLLPKDALFFLQDSGYYHSPNGDCPWDPDIRRSRKCTCVTDEDFTWDESSCIPKWFEIHNLEKPRFAPHYDFVNQHVPDPVLEATGEEAEDNG